jgi:hypothetical protein
MKKCSRCKETKDVSSFHKLRKAEDGLQSTCKVCQLEARRSRNNSKPRKILKVDEFGKTCGSCAVHKPFNEFYKSSIKGQEGKYRPTCKKCISEKTKARRKVDGEKMREISKKSREKHKDNPKHKERDRRYYQANKEAYKRRYEEYMKDPEFVANKMKVAEEWRQNNLERLAVARRKRRSERLKEDPVYKLKCNVRARLNYSLKNKRVRKTKSTVDYIGCNWETLWKHLGDTFEANYGMPREWLTRFEYEIDHVEPIAKAETVDEVIRRSHYTNLQILLTEDNRSKKDREDWDLLEEGII